MSLSDLGPFAPDYDDPAGRRAIEEAAAEGGALDQAKGRGCALCGSANIAGAIRLTDGPTGDQYHAVCAACMSEPNWDDKLVRVLSQQN
jgi:hypothetical protein